MGTQLTGRRIVKWTRVNNKYEITEYGQLRRVDNQQIITPILKRGRPVIRMTLDGKRKMYKVHRLVALVFIPNPLFNVKKLVCHRDDNVHNNHISNLYWGTHTDNQIDAERNGKWKPEMCNPKVQK